MAMSAENRSKFAALHIGNGDVYIWVQKLSRGTKNPYKQSHRQMLYVLTSSQCQGLLHSDLYNENAIILLNDESQTNQGKKNLFSKCYRPPV